MNRTTHHKQGPAWAALVTAAALCLALAPAATAADIAQVRAGSGGLDFQPRVEYGALVLTVSGPDGFHHRAEFGAGESPAFSIFDQAGGVLPDGSYTWELSVVPSDSQRRDAFEANRMEVKRGGVERQVQTGGFAVVAGSVVAGGETEPGAGPGGAGNVLNTKDQVIPDDLIVQMSLCVGFDCVNNENFGFDTIRLKENNLRIHFDDTSSTGSFPNNDWRLVANDSANGGRNVFYLEDSTSGREVFSVEAGAPTNSVWVDATAGNVGFGTSTPVLQLHVKDGNTPGLRLEQDGSSGFTAQTWDVAGNEANFFVRSVTTGSQLPFRLRPGAPTSSIDVAADGDVGIGTSSPDAALHVERSNGTAQLLVEETSATEEIRQNIQITNNGRTQMRLTDTSPDGGNSWFFGTREGAFQINEEGDAGQNDFILSAAGSITIPGTITTGGSCSVGCDRVFDPDFAVESIEEHAALMWANRHLPGVGPTPENGPFNLTEKTTGMLNELEKAHIYIGQLNDHLKARDERVEQLEGQLEERTEEIDGLAERLARLEAASVEE